MSFFESIEYCNLNSRQQENYNFQKVSAELADYGFNCLRLTDDWQGADFIACHIDGERFLKIQLKGRLTVDMKYHGKEIYIAFFDGEDCYVYPHDEVLERILALGKMKGTTSWEEGRSYAWPGLPKWAISLMKEFKV